MTKAHRIGEEIASSSSDLAGHAQQVRSRTTRDKVDRSAARSKVDAANHKSRVTIRAYQVGPFIATVELGIVDGLLQPLSMSLRGYVGPFDDAVRPLVAADLRRVPFGALVDRAIDDWRAFEGKHAKLLETDQPLLGESYLEMERAAQGRTQRVSDATKRRRGRPPVDPERIARAAQLFDPNKNRDPYRVIEKTMGVSRTTAYRYVTRAREQGLLPRPKKKGKKR